jgi:hypothetical protein
LLTLAVLLGAFALAPAAAAQDPYDDAALVDQYGEDLPTAEGPQPSTGAGGAGSGGGSGGGGAGGTGAEAGVPLAADIENGLTKAVGKQDADQLREVATSPRFGAPDRVDAPVATAEEPSPLTAAVDALGEEGGSSLVPIFLALAAVAAAMLGAAAAQRRRRA